MLALPCLVAVSVLIQNCLVVLFEFIIFITIIKSCRDSLILVRPPAMDIMACDIAMSHHMAGGVVGVG